MGAWGEGMRENDTALDAISFYDDHVSFTEIMKMCGAEGTLGLAEELLERGIKPPRFVLQAAARAVKARLADDELQRWREPETRREALLQFERAVKGLEPVREAKGLLAKIFEYLPEKGAN